jgi:hypothetical protein
MDGPEKWSGVVSLPSECLFSCVFSSTTATTTKKVLGKDRCGEMSLVVEPRGETKMTHRSFEFFGSRRHLVDQVMYIKDEE